MAEHAKYRVLFVGCGAVAGGYDMRDTGAAALPMSHAGAYLCHGRFALSACVDPDVDRRSAFVRHWNVPVGVSRIEDLPDSHRHFDVVAICSPTDLHARHLGLVLGMRPRLVVCEKPVTSSVEETSFWISRYEVQGVPLLVNYTRRWAPDVRRWAAALSAGEKGQLKAVSGLYNKGVLNNGSHMIDLLHMFCGDLLPVAAGPPRYDYSDLDPSVPFVLNTGSGVPITVNVSDAADYALFELQFITSAGVLVMEEGGLRWRVRSVVDSPRFPGYRALDSGTFQDGEYASAMSAMIANQYEHLMNGSALACTGREALAAQTLCEKLRQMSLSSSVRCDVPA